MFSFFLDLSRKLPGVASPLKIASLESDDNRIFTYETLNRSKRSYPKILGNNGDGGGKTGEGEGPLLKKGAFPLPRPHPYPPKTFVWVVPRRGSAACRTLGVRLPAGRRKGRERAGFEHGTRIAVRLPRAADAEEERQIFLRNCARQEKKRVSPYPLFKRSR